MWRFLSKVNQHLVVVIPGMMLAGFCFGLWVNPAQLKALILPFTFLMVYPMMVNLNVKKVVQGGDRKAQFLAQAINFLVIPFLAYAIGHLFFAEQPYLALGLLLTGLVPTSGMTISWTGFARGNLEAAVKMTIVGLILGSLLTPFYLQALLGARIELDMAGVFRQIVLIVFLPMLAGQATRSFCLRRYGQSEFQTRISPRFPPLSTLGVLGIVFIAMALKARGIATHPDQLLSLIPPLILLYACNYLLSSLVGRTFLPREDAIALVYGTVMRNLSIALAIAINAFGAVGSDAALVIAVAYIIQVQSAAWSVKLKDSVFGVSDEVVG